MVSLTNLFKGSAGEVLTQESPLIAPAAARMDSVWLMQIVKAAVLTAVFIAPFLYLNFTQDIHFVKVVVVEIAAMIAAVAWLLNVLVTRRINYARSPFNIIFLALALVMFAATVLSKAPWFSFWGPDATGEKTASILAFIVLSFVIGSVFRRKDVERTGQALLASFILLGLFTLFSVAANRWQWQLPAWLNANPIGTVNSLAYVLAAGFVFALTLALSRKTASGRKTISSLSGTLAIVTSAILFLPVILIGFRLLWAAVAVATLLMVTANFARSWRKEGEAPEHGLGRTAVGIGFLVLVLSLFFVYKPLPFAAKIFQPPFEVSPSFTATLKIGGEVLKDRPVLGVGPGNFLAAYNLFRDRSLNDTAFWAARFSHGFAFLPTLISTMGVLGVAVFAALVLSVFVVFGRAFWKVKESHAFLWAAWAGSAFVAAMWFLYVPNFTVSFLLFIFIGLATVLFSEEAALSPVAAEDGAAQPANPAKTAWLEISRCSAPIHSPTINFVVSLAVVFVSAFSLVALYSLATQYAAEAYFIRALRVMNLYGNTDTAKVFLDRAIGFNSVEDKYYQAKSQVHLVALNRIVAKAAAGSKEDLSGQFRSELAEAVKSAKSAADLNPSDAQNWFGLGQVYESAIPYNIANADKSALDGYDRARGNDPSNPIFPLAVARVHVTNADLLTLQINQTSSGDQRSRLEQVRKEYLAKAKEALDAAVNLKSDFAGAHFLLAQVAIRENNIQEAIKSTAATARLAPGDIGVAFQLGVLYYRADQLDNAKAEFERAILINDNYSNARYFLGLIWDRKGDQDAALSQFQKIAALNPDSEEVKKIIANLETGKRALEGIVPPAPAPENRKEAPVKESGKKSELTPAKKK